MAAWVKELKNFLPDGIPIMIAGNKCDLALKKVDLEQAKRYALSVNSTHF